MAIVPDFIRVWIEAHVEVVIAWLSEVVYERLVASQGEELLVQIQGVVDFGPIERVCGGYHHETGAGEKPKHTVARLVRALLVKYVRGYSLRELEQALRYDLRVRWFVGYGLLERVVDYTRLERFEQWVLRNHLRVFFDETLAQIDAALPEERGGVQIGDTFAMHARAGCEGLVRLLRHTCECLLRAWQDGCAKETQPLLTASEREALFGAPEERSEYHLSEAERLTRLRTTLQAITVLEQRVAQRWAECAAEQQAALRLRLADLAKIRADELAGSGESATLLPEEQKGSYRLGSASDREATYRNHGGTVSLGYNISLAITPHGLIRAIQAATGAEPDQCGVPRLIAEQLDQHQPAPTKLIYDRAASAGKTRAAVEQVSLQRTQLVAPLAPPTHGDRFGPQHFTLASDGATLTCPAQQHTASAYRASDRDGRIFTFPAPVCQACPLAAQCRSPKSKPTAPRKVFLSDYLAQVRQARAYNQTQDFHLDMQLRPLVERIIFMLTHDEDARQARRVGSQPADFQAKMAATVRNLKTALALRAARSPA